VSCSDDEEALGLEGSEEEVAGASPDGSRSRLGNASDRGPQARSCAGQRTADAAPPGHLPSPAGPARVAGVVMGGAGLGTEACAVLARGVLGVGGIKAAAPLAGGREGDRRRVYTLPAEIGSEHPRNEATGDLAPPRCGVEAIERSAVVGPKPLVRPDVVADVVADGPGRPGNAASELSCEGAPWPEAARVESESPSSVDVMDASPAGAAASASGRDSTDSKSPRDDGAKAAPSREGREAGEGVPAPAGDLGARDSCAEDEVQPWPAGARAGGPSPTPVRRHRTASGLRDDVRIGRATTLSLISRRTVGLGSTSSTVLG
jgi:hypothetical protein